VYGRPNTNALKRTASFTRRDESLRSASWNCSVPRKLSLCAWKKKGTVERIFTKSVIGKF
jgi:hypothetical protein